MADSRKHVQRPIVPAKPAFKNVIDTLSPSGDNTSPTSTPVLKQATKTSELKESSSPPAERKIKTSSPVSVPRKPESSPRNQDVTRSIRKISKLPMPTEFKAHNMPTTPPADHELAQISAVRHQKSPSILLDGLEALDLEEKLKDFSEEKNKRVGEMKEDEKEVGELIHQYRAIRMNTVSPTSTDKIIKPIKSGVREELEFDAYGYTDDIWAENLKHCPDVVLEQLTFANEETSLFTKLVGQFADIQAEYAERLQNMIEKTDKWKWPVDEMESINTETATLRKFIREFASAQKNASKIMKSSVARKMQIVSREYSSALEDIQAMYKQSEDTLKQRAQLLSKRKQKCIKILDSFSKKMSTKGNKSIDTALKAYKSCLRYDKLVNKSNKMFALEVDIRRPIILRKMQRLEEFRHVMFTGSLQDVDTALVEMAHLINGLRFGELTKHPFLNRDIGKFTKNVLARRPDPQKEKKQTLFNYDLPIPLEDIQNNIDAKDRRKLGIGMFDHNSLVPLMTAQKMKLAQVNLPIPFLRLRAMVNFLDGFHTEGIFRISPGYDDLETFILQLEDGDYTLTTKNPHVPATALKQWLLGLDEPLIPQIFHSKCQTAEGKTEESIKSLMPKLPPENVALLHALTAIARKISSKENIEFTKMELSSVAMVFTPAFFANRGSDEDFEMKTEVDEINFISRGAAMRRVSAITNKDSSAVVNMYAQTAFVAAVFECLIVRTELINEEFDNDVIVPASAIAKSSVSKSQAPKNPVTIISTPSEAIVPHSPESVPISTPTLVESPFELNDEDQDEYKDDMYIEIDWSQEPLPDGWSRYWDEDGNAYYGNDATGDTQWEHPYSVYLEQTGQL